MAAPVTTSTINAASYATQTASSTSSATSSPSASHVNNNPLLFFVALGFGVLFTNLWIIIGVKYCFRYQTARRRGLAMGADGVAMGNIHHGRRRREKKLMTMEEVQSQFPLMTYKSWRAQRERQGLSTEGGVQAVGQEEAQNAREMLTGQVQPSRAASIRTVRTQRAGSMHSIEPVDTIGSGVYELGQDGAQKMPKDDQDITEVEKPIAKSTPSKRTSTMVEREMKEPDSPHSRTSINSTRPKDISEPANGEEESAEQSGEADAGVDEAEIAHLPEDIGSGDTCAICIDTLEEDDEIRGLTCGHAFHSSCVDVWLTTRRAICPLCKKDYWVRKPPAAGATDDTTEGATNAASGNPNGSSPMWRTNFLARRFGMGRNTTAAAGTSEPVDLEHGQRDPEPSSSVLARVQVMNR
ncbi:protein of unknown function [Taphrina deformans PYCC 5710]|uniref:RING-type domain-containing protein n=1 Tax=Taphrina deformans (strain PYCC 5710 / ATCC 11124 / CBS 356.35 / IMI 108563 / JCM 9778 / NBRC 8474) TaxID=1097556 RepID=R4XES5_TAPDE|nr:protein of unknown function [Taphrina deformans PYCC 5710]|eukprot:CCG84357.1 protein of unknown function [Taphrina deformans PYCC 5710]